MLSAVSTLRSHCCLNAAGDQLTLPADPDSDLEHLIRGGPFELSLAADRLGNNLFGIQSDLQVNVAHIATLPIPDFVNRGFAVFAETS